MKFRNILKSLFEIALTAEETDNSNDYFVLYLHFYQTCQVLKT